MRVWPAFLAPLIALIDQAVAYSLVQWACATQHLEAIHWAHFVFFAVAVTVTLPAWTEARRHDAMPVAAAMSGALSALVIIAMWAPTWFLSPCLG